MSTLPKFDGSTYYWVYFMPSQQMPRYLTPTKDFSTHTYNAEVFRDSASLEDALEFMRSIGLVPSITPSDEQPADPRYHGPQPNKSWRNFQKWEQI